MKIRKIKWNKNPILGDLELDFLNPETNEPYNTIIIAGENGTGKTTILDTVAEFLSIGPITPFEFIEYQIDSKVYRASPTPDGRIASFFSIQDLETKEITRVYSNKQNNLQEIYSNLLDPRHYGCAYTKARANYVANPIRSITSDTIDSDIYKENSESDATKIKQLLIDVYSQDSEDVMSTLNQNPNQSITFEDFAPTSRMIRFTSAFNSFFEGALSFDRVETKDGEKKLLFKKYGREITIDDLSTGESQIVYRGAYLLKNAGKLNEGIIFVDEPEISMHPSWQQRIFSYYKGLFTVDKHQTAQLFMATHSDGVIREALKNQEDTKIIILKSTNGQVTYAGIQVPLVLKNISSAEISYQAFGVASTDYHNALYGYIEAEGLLNKYKENKPLYPYIRLDNKTKQLIPEEKCLSERIRHIIHHPENLHNEYTEGEIRDSIEMMRQFIINNISSS